MDAAVLEWLTKMLDNAGYRLVPKNNIHVFRSTVDIDRTLLERAEDRWKLGVLCDDLCVERLASDLMRAPWVMRREKEALTNGKDLRFSLEMTVYAER